MITVMLYGELGAKFGKVHRYAAKTAAECVRAMAATLPGFREYFSPNYYKVIRGGKEILSLDATHMPQSGNESIRIIPVVSGAKSSFFGIILGALLIVVAPHLGLSVAMAGNVAAMGWSMVMGGIAQLLFATDSAPKVQSYEAVENRPNYSFNGAVNTVQQGNPVPLCYGRLIIGSQVISAGLTVQEN